MAGRRALEDLGEEGRGRADTGILASLPRDRINTGHLPGTSIVTKDFEREKFINRFNTKDQMDILWSGMQVLHAFKKLW